MLQIEKLRVEYRENPIGLDVAKPRFSWILKTEKENCMQSAYRLCVMETANADLGAANVVRPEAEHADRPDADTGDTAAENAGRPDADTVAACGPCVWDSLRVESDQSVLVEYAGASLKPETAYRYRVTVWDREGECAEAEGSFETGLLQPENMAADWITSGFGEEEKACPVFTRSFMLRGEVKKARLYATALGLYEIELNGEKVGDAYFAPGWTSYGHRIQYQTYDVTEMLRKAGSVPAGAPGKDSSAGGRPVCMQITVADGWYKGPFGFTLRPNIYGDQTAALAELHITYADGSVQTVKTDGDWQVQTGRIRESQIYFGETFDSTWGSQSSAPQPAHILAKDKSMLTAQESEPVRITCRTEAKELIVTPKGELVLDFGQNMSGFVEVHVTGRDGCGALGQKILVHHAETLDKDGNFYPETLRQAVSVDTYICDGTERVFRPHFTFHGFRYIRLEGIEKDAVRPENFVACTLHTDMELTGSFHCSDERVNRLWSNIGWGMRGNFLDIPTDCPQRDERLGWTGDAQVFSATASYLRNTALFYEKWLRDLKAEQTKEWGVPHVIPNILGDQASAAAWSDAATVIPWVVYETFGDKRVLEEQFESMKGWVDYITEHCGENGLWQNGFQYGDWLALDKEESADRTGATDKYLVANAYYAYSCGIVAKAAKALGREDEAVRYEALCRDITERFNDEYITRTGRMVSETQTGCVLALHFHLAKEEYRERILGSLVNNIENHKNHLATGFVGTPYLCLALSDCGRHDLAGTIFLQEDYPSWLYAVKMGATTIWERWNSIMPDGSFDVSGMNSLNHYAYGSIGEWMVKKVAGLTLLEPGYKRFRVKPMFGKGITHAEAVYESVYGTIRAAWKCEDHQITVDVTVPANTSAEILLPEKDGVITVGSGTYHYAYATRTSLEKARYSMDSTLQQIVAEPLAVELFNRYAPGALDGPMIQFAYQMTMAEMCAVAPEARPLYEMIVNTLNAQCQ